MPGSKIFPRRRSWQFGAIRRVEAMQVLAALGCKIFICCKVWCFCAGHDLDEDSAKDCSSICDWRARNFPTVRRIHEAPARIRTRDRKRPSIRDRQGIRNGSPLRSDDCRFGYATRLQGGPNRHLRALHASAVACGQESSQGADRTRDYGSRGEGARPRLPRLLRRRISPSGAGGKQRAWQGCCGKSSGCTGCISIVSARRGASHRDGLQSRTGCAARAGIREVLQDDPRGGTSRGARARQSAL